ncbi:MAG: M1 family peptidase [Flavobacterium sp.]|nr:MAG: M1 family peptidase [Flavobacterium sp.]
MKKLLLPIVLLSLTQLHSQQFTRKDSLRGGLSPERVCYDVQRYDLDLTINPDKKFLSGSCVIGFNLINPTKRMQIDLFQNMKIDSILMDNKRVNFTREFDAVFLDFPEILAPATGKTLFVYYNGNPVIAKNAPWDGGFDWKKDKNGKHFVGVAVQGTGASLWYPCKDSQSDEPDHGATIKIAVPNGLMNVSNGRLIGSTDLKNGYTRWDWEVKNPINNYDITVNIGDYILIHENYNGLDLDYYVLRDNQEKARAQFEVVKPMMDCFRRRFGEYPFADDSYKLVESTYLGMEHQSAVAYGNQYRKGYLGSDISGTGVGLLFDFIIVHESAHEWFGNSITSKDIADMWIHEGFTTYAESVFVECQYGYDKAMTYINGQKRNIVNDRPIIGHYDVNNEGSSDMYFKGALMINSLRHVINNDAKWWEMLLRFSRTFRYSITDTPTVIQFFNKESGLDLTPFFTQYLTTTKIPVLRLTLKGGRLEYSWENCNPDFNMPVDVIVADNTLRLFPTVSKKSAKIKKTDRSEIKVPTDHFLIQVKLD